jgi:hypothetical protein
MALFVYGSVTFQKILAGVAVLGPWDVPPTPSQVGEERGFSHLVLSPMGGLPRLGWSCPWAQEPVLLCARK